MAKARAAHFIKGNGMNNNITIVVVTAILMGGSASAQQSDTASTPLSTQDQQFLTDLSQSTLGEVALGKLAAQKGATPSVRLFGRWMASTDALANKQLATMSHQLRGAVPPTEVTKEQRTEYRTMEQLSGPVFDRQYLQMMVPGHQKEIAIFEREARDGQNPLVKVFAQQMIQTANEHLDAVRDLISTRER